MEKKKHRNNITKKKKKPPPRIPRATVTAADVCRRACGTLYNILLLLCSVAYYCNIIYVILRALENGIVAERCKVERFKDGTAAAGVGFLRPETTSQKKSR